jgi:GNAT superfamily N-acetyltransferase
MALTQRVDAEASRSTDAEASRSTDAEASRSTDAEASRSTDEETSRRASVRVRASRPGEGLAIAALWRELWDAHQGWGGYAGSHDEAVYLRLANRLNEDARVRAGRPLLGSHVHLVAEVEGAPCGQVEGWLERRGPGALAPVLCEVRSLVVTGRARGLGVGRSLLDVLGQTAQALAPVAPCLLAAEVLEPNPARSFYARVGFAPVAWSASVDASEGASSAAARSSGALVARTAGALDAPAISRLEGILADRRRAAGDLRFEPPRAIDSAILAAIAAHLAADAREQGDAATIVAVDRWGTVRGAASIIVQTLDPPFIAVRRSLVGRFALDPAYPALALLAPLVALGCRFAESRGAVRVELTDLSAPGTDLYEAALAIGARPWSHVVQRPSSVPCPRQPHG